MAVQGGGRDGVGDVLDVLARLGALSAASDLDAAIGNILDLFAELSGLESVYLTRIDWERGIQHIGPVRNVDPDRIEISDGLELPWEDTLCRRAMEDGWGWQTDVPSAWADATPAIDAGVVSFVSVPVVVGDVDRPYGSLCGIAPDQRAPDERVPTMLRLLARVVGDLVAKESELVEARAGLELAQQRLDERIRFAAQVEHGLRAPLAVLRGWLATLQDPRLVDDELRVRGLAASDRAAETLESRVAELLTESRLAVREVERVEVDLRALALEHLPEAWSETHDVEIVGDVVVRSDPVVLAVLLEHLVENAVRHTPDGTGVRVLLARSGSSASVTVEDDGPGLPDRDDLFEPFVTADPDPARRGTGLGLHIVHELAVQLGATIDAGNRPEGGARFVVTLGDGA